MNSFIFIGRTFFYQTVGIIREIKAQEPESKCTMLVAARSDTLDLLNSYEDLSYSQFDWLSEHEEKWLNTPLEKSKLEFYENKFGTQKLRAIVTSDRELGIGFVSGGVYAESKLLKLARDDDDARWRYVVGLLDYLYKTFERDKPDFVFAYCIAAATPYAMYLVAEDLGITFIQPVSTRMGGSYVIDDTIEQSLTLVKKTFAEALVNKDLVKDFIPQSEAYISKLRNQYTLPEYIEKMQKTVVKQSSILGMLKVLCIDIARWGAIIGRLKGTKGVLRQRKGWAIMLENFNVFFESRKALKGEIFENVDIDSIGKYIYYPLHVDPEASTMVLADQLTDQAFIVESIAKNMPVDIKLLVKEHIPSIGRRPKGFYERIRNMPDVKLISPFMDSSELIKKSSVVFSITGTAVWEAIIIGKPAIMMANAFYKSIGKGFVECSEISEIGKSIKLAMDISKVEDERLKIYISSLLKENVHFPESIWYDPETKSENEVSKAVINKICKLIELRKNKQILDENLQIKGGECRLSA